MFCIKKYKNLKVIYRLIKNKQLKRLIIKNLLKIKIQVVFTQPTSSKGLRFF